MKHILLSFLILLISCTNNKKLPYFKKDLTSKSERKNRLFVFVGEKIVTKELQQDIDSWDGKYHGKYKILERIYGNYPKDTIDFIAYDHYGIPEFSFYKHVLLFVTEHKGIYYHEKYQYDDVYMTNKNMWAGAFKVHDTSAYPKPEKISFLEKIAYKIKDSGIYTSNYYEPFYKIIGDSAYPVYGNYVNDLFRIKKEGVLKWRGLFGKGNENWEDSIVDVQMAEVKSN